MPKRWRAHSYLLSTYSKEFGWQCFIALVSHSKLSTSFRLFIIGSIQIGMRYSYGTGSWVILIKFWNNLMSEYVMFWWYFFKYTECFTSWIDMRASTLVSSMPFNSLHRSAISSSGRLTLCCYKKFWGWSMKVKYLSCCSITVLPSVANGNLSVSI